MTTRTPESLCMLCLLRKANATGSHFAPNGLIKGSIGARNLEIAVTIDPHNPNPAIEHHYGSGVLSNTNPTPPPNPHVRDYIFCSQCEKQLSTTESVVLSFLNQDLKDVNKRRRFTDTEITPHATLLELPKPHRNVFNLFFYSVVWRICLQQRLENNTCVVSAAFEERIRSILARYIPMSIDELEKETIDWPYDFTVLMCPEVTVNTPAFINPNHELTNP